MKNSLKCLFALIVSVCVFTACSDDDDNSWKQLPKGEITADKVELNLNGQSTTGTVNFTALSLSAAQMEIKDVIDGYSDITVDMKMEKQDDGSFKLDGTKEIATKPVTRTENKPAPFLTVKVTGTITSDGKLTVEISATGTGLYIGTYTATNLVLTYGNAPLTGKGVVFDATDGSNVSILLNDVVPGEAQTILTGAQLSSDGFSGTTTTDNATVAYTGSLANKVLTLNLNVTMKDTKGWAKTYELGDLIKGDVEYYIYGRKGLRPPLNQQYELKKSTKENTVIGSAGYVKMTNVIPDNATRKDSINSYGLTSTYPTLFRGLLGCILPQVLQSVTLEKDGNITASYSSNPVIFDLTYMLKADGDGEDSITPDKVEKLKAGRTWTQSPKNLAFWFEKDGKLYVKLNISAIIAQAIGGNSELAGVIGSILNSDVTTLKALLKSLNMDITNALVNMDDATFTMLLDWVKNGVPLKVTADNNHTYIYLDRDVLDPLMKEMPNLLPLVVNMIPEEYNSPMLISTLQGFVDSYWFAGKFELGLDLKAKQ